MFTKAIKRLGIYLVALFILIIISHLLLKLHYNHNYSKEKAEKLLSSVSTYKFFSDNPCSVAIIGDPVDAGLQYVKINLHCDKIKKTFNTLDLRAVKTATPKGLLTLLGNINGFRSEISNAQVISLGGLKTTDSGRWRCFTESGLDMEIKDFNVPLKKQQSINCFFNFDDSSVSQYYEHF